MRRKGKPNDLKETVHDRRAQDLLRNAQVAIDEVEDPFGDKITVVRSTRKDPLAEMKTRGLINQCEFYAGRHWQNLHENAEIGGVRAIDPSKEAVDGGRPPEVLTDRQRKAVEHLKAARAVLGPVGNALVYDVLARHWSISRAADARGYDTERGRLYVGTRFRECLDTLAMRFGYAVNTQVMK